jgi:hypothetical protein
MIRRIFGLFMIIVVLLPLLVGVLLFTSVSRLVADVGGVVEPRIATINDRIATIDESLVTVEGAVDRINNSITAFNNDIAAIRDTVRDTLDINVTVPLPDLPDVRIRIPVINRRITIPLPDLSDVNLEIPGLREVRGFLDDIFGYFDRVAATMRDLAEIQTVSQELGAIAGETSAMVNAVGATVARQSRDVVLAVGLLVAWVALTYIVVVYRYLSDGWRMLTGKST